MHLSESMLARVQITVRTTPGKIPPFDVRELEARLAPRPGAGTTTCAAALVEPMGEARGNELLRRFAGAFPAGYREDVRGARGGGRHRDDGAVCAERGRSALACTGRSRPRPACCASSCFHRGAPVPLSDSLPMLERMGLRVHRRAPVPDVRRRGGRRSGCTTSAWRRRRPTPKSTSTRCSRLFEEAFGAHLPRRGRERRLQPAGRSRRALPADEIVVLRAYAKYMRQIGFPLSQAFIEATLAAHAGIARRLVELFKARFDPARRQRGAGAGRAGDARDRGGARRRSTTCPRTACCGSTSR